jgi:Uma2 family endonuclease
MSLALGSLPHRKFTVEEYHNFIDSGVFKPEERLELWEGEFIEMSPIGKRHAGTVSALSDMLNNYLGKQVLVWSQNPIVLSDFSEPQPDVTLLKRRDDFYRTVNATASDVLLTMEVSDTTGKFDRDIKFPRSKKRG